MIRLITVAFALVVSTSAQATPLAPLQQPDGMITQVREACGAGMHMVNGHLRANRRPPQRRQVCGWDAISGWSLR